MVEESRLLDHGPETFYYLEKCPYDITLPPYSLDCHLFCFAFHFMRSLSACNARSL